MAGAGERIMSEQGLTGSADFIYEKYRPSTRRRRGYRVSNSGGCQIAMCCVMLLRAMKDLVHGFFGFCGSFFTGRFTQVSLRAKPLRRRADVV
jgi:hypothetical protein